MCKRLIGSVAFLGAVAAAALAAPSSGRADVIYPWCAYYGGSDDGATNCYFATYQQCMDAISGNGGYCDRNPFWIEPPARDRGPRVRGPRVR